MITVPSSGIYSITLPAGRYDYRSLFPSANLAWDFGHGRNVRLTYSRRLERPSAGMLNPEVPNNAGSLAPIRVEAPVGSIVKAVSPQPCTARHVVGMFLPMPIMQALAQIVPTAVMAEEP